MSAMGVQGEEDFFCFTILATATTMEANIVNNHIRITHVSSQTMRRHQQKHMSERMLVLARNHFSKCELIIYLLFPHAINDLHAEYGTIEYVVVVLVFVEKSSGKFTPRIYYLLLHRAIEAKYIMKLY